MIYKIFVTLILLILIPIVIISFTTIIFTEKFITKRPDEAFITKLNKVFLSAPIAIYMGFCDIWKIDMVYKRWMI